MNDPIKPRIAILQALHMLYTVYRLDEADSDRLAHETGLPRQTLTGTLNILVNKKEVARTEHKLGTKRVYRYSITTAGREALAKSIAPSSTPADTASDKPGVSESETTPEAAIAQGSSLAGEGAARHETPSVADAPLPHAEAAEGDGLQWNAANPYEGDIQAAKMQDHLAAIGMVAHKYMQEGDFILRGVETMDMLIDAHTNTIQQLTQDLAFARLAVDERNHILNQIKDVVTSGASCSIPYLPKIIDQALEAHTNTIRALHHNAEWMRARIEELEKALSIAEKILDAPAHENFDGPFVVASTWHEAETAEEAENIARDVARTMRHGQAVVAKPVSRVNLTVKFENFSHVPPSQLASAA